MGTYSLEQRGGTTLGPFEEIDAGLLQPSRHAYRYVAVSGGGIHSALLDQRHGGAARHARIHRCGRARLRRHHRSVDGLHQRPYPQPLRSPQAVGFPGHTHHDALHLYALHAPGGSRHPALCDLQRGPFHRHHHDADPLLRLGGGALHRLQRTLPGHRRTRHGRHRRQPIRAASARGGTAVLRHRWQQRSADDGGHHHAGPHARLCVALPLEGTGTPDLREVRGARIQGPQAHVAERPVQATGAGLHDRFHRAQHHHTLVSVLHRRCPER